jgi:hypothetical protein
MLVNQASISFQLWFDVVPETKKVLEEIKSELFGEAVKGVVAQGLLKVREVRREFLEVRDEAYSLLSLGRDPGKPGKCPDYCPYLTVCMEEKI